MTLTLTNIVYTSWIVELDDDTTGSGRRRGWSFSLTSARSAARGWAGRERWAAARCKGLGKHPGETARGDPRPEGAPAGAHGRPGALGEGPCGLESDWWQEIW